MPEGPEVLNIVEQMNFYLYGKTINSFEFIDGRYFLFPPENFDKFKESLPVKIKKVFCRGKLIIIKTESWYILNSLRMTGSWRIDEENQYTKCRIHLEPQDKVPDIDTIVFNDVRNFATFEFCKEVELRKKLSKINKGFLGKEKISLSEFTENLKKCKHSSLVSKLMDQKSICSGIGNYLLSEILYDSNIHPSILCSQLSVEKIETIYNSCMKIINRSYELNGVSMKDYVDIFGQKGEFGNELKVYGRKTDPYGNKIIKRKGSHGRTVWMVPGLQRKDEEDED